MRARTGPVRPAGGRRVVLARLVALLLLGAAAAFAGDVPLTTADVVVFLRFGVAEEQILAELHDQGFGEALGAAREKALREAGASETLVVAIRRAAPEGPQKASAPVSAAGALPAASAAAKPLEPTFAARARSVRVPVSVLDKGGQPVMGLQQTDFRISEDGRRQDVTLFSGERRPLRVALALDVSGSMENKASQVEAAFKYFIDLLEPADEVLVMTFSADVHIVQDFTSNRDLLASALDAPEPAGGTALYDAAYEAIKRVAAGHAESKAVVLVTDGVDTKSSTSFERLRELARRSEVPVFSIGLDWETKGFHSAGHAGHAGGGGGHGGWPGGVGGGWPGGGGGFGGGGYGGGGGHRGGGSHGGGRKGFDGQPLIDLADETGGTAQILKGPEHYSPGSDTPDSGRLKAAVESIAMVLRHRYLVGYEPAEGKPGWRAIHVDVDRPSTTTRARKGYYAAG
jgi:VWFA-related protein